MKKIIMSGIAAFILIAAGSGSLVSAEGTSAFIDNAPVIGEYKPNSYYEHIEREKLEQLAIQSRATTPTAKSLSIKQVPQEKDNWCGYAALKSLLDFEATVMTQKEIAEEVYDPNSPCPWYLSNGNSMSEFPAVQILRKNTGFAYVPYPLGAAGSTTITESDIKDKIVSTICEEHGVLACGRSQPSGDSHLPKYPSSYISHWIVVTGYGNRGSTVMIADPAKSSAISWSKNIDATYSLKTYQLAAYVSEWRRIIW